jgi:hypothetical protein
MREIKQIGASGAHHHPGMTAVDLVVSAGARRSEQIAVLHGPVQKIIRAINPESFP